MNNDTTTDTDFDPTIAMDFTDDPFVNEEDAILDADDWDDWEEERTDSDDIASAWGF